MDINVTQPQSLIRAQPHLKKYCIHRMVISHQPDAFAMILDSTEQAYRDMAYGRT